jgi:hypothetical protein
MKIRSFIKIYNKWNKLPNKNEYNNLKIYFNNNKYHIIEIPKDATKIKLEIVNNKNEEEENEYLTRMSNRHVLKY